MPDKQMHRKFDYYYFLQFFFFIFGPPGGGRLHNHKNLS